MSYKLPNYLRTYRKHTALSQDEVACLLGCNKGTKVSRHELSARVPSIEALLAYEIILDVPLRELFAGMFEKVEDLTRERAERLIVKLTSQKLNRVTAKKLLILSRLVPHAETDPHDAE
jgi:transcriptional regulator with XRE-family HTH domain